MEIWILRHFALRIRRSEVRILLGAPGSGLSGLIAQPGSSGKGRSLRAHNHRNLWLAAVRIPEESFALRLAKRAEFTITATGDNPSGMSPAKDVPTVLRYF